MTAGDFDQAIHERGIKRTSITQSRRPCIWTVTLYGRFDFIIVSTGSTFEQASEGAFKRWDEANDHTKVSSCTL